MKTPILQVPTTDLLVVGLALLCWGLWLFAGAIAEQRAIKRRARLQQEKFDRMDTAEHRVLLKQWGPRK